MSVPSELFAVVFPDGGSTTFAQKSEAELYAGRMKQAYGPLIVARFVLDGPVPLKPYEAPTVRALCCRTCKHAALDEDADLMCTKLVQGPPEVAAFSAGNEDGPAANIWVADDFGCVLHEQKS